MKTNKTLILSGKDVERLVDMKRAIYYVERAFRDYALGKAQMPAKVYLYLDKYNGDFRAMPAYLESMDTCVVKWVNVHPNNKRIGLPTVMATLILSDPKTAYPLCIMDGTYLTSLRTGAAGGVAAKYLARKNSSVVGLVGCGVQAKTQLLALKEYFPIKKVYVWGHKPSFVKEFIKTMRRLPYTFVASDSIKQCVANADIIVTTTPSRKPLVKREWLKEGAHINAIGADAKGKQELEANILKQAKVVIDDLAQASHSGEINVPWAKHLITQKQIYAQLGDIVIGRKKGRTNNREITVFDSTGLAIQDAAVAKLIYQTALRKRLGKWVKLI